MAGFLHKTLKYLREQHGKSRSCLSRELKFPYDTYVEWERGIAVPGEGALYKLADYYQVSVDYILNTHDWCEEDVMFPDEQSVGFSNEDVHIIKQFRRLFPNNADAVNKLVSQLLEDQDKQTTSSDSKSARRKLEKYFTKLKHKADDFYRD